METLAGFKTEPPDNLTQLKWGSILGGVIITLVAGWLFNLLGLAIGLTTFATSNDPIPHMGMGSTLWLTLGGVISMFLGGWVAAQSASISRKSQAMLYGILTWAVTIILSFLIVVIAAGAAVSTASNLMGQGLSLAAEGAATAGKGAIEIAPQLIEIAQNTFPDLNATVEQIKEQANQALARANQNEMQVTDDSTEPSPRFSASPEAMKDQLGDGITSFLTAENEEAIAAAKKKLVMLLTQYTGVSQIQAEQQVNDWQEKYHQAKEKVNQAVEEGKQKAVTAAKKTSKAFAQIALTTFFMLLAEGVAAASGGLMGAKKRKIPQPSEGRYSE